MEDIFKQVEKNIDNLVVNNVEWAMPATQEQMQAARNGHLELSFFDYIINPLSLMYVPDVKVVFKECYRWKSWQPGYMD